MKILTYKEAIIRVLYPRGTNQIYRTKCEDKDEEDITLQALKLLVAIQHTED